MPFGPKVVRTVSATAFAAAMLVFCAPFPVFLVEPSGNINIGCTLFDIEVTSSFSKRKSSDKFFKPF
jgi:hypothetical protein